MRRARITLSLLLVVLGLVACTRDVSRRLLFRADRARASAVPKDAILRTLIARDGVPVHALELPGPPGARVVVHFHNNSDSMTGDLAPARALHANGMGVLLVEYRGYGMSRGEASPDEQGVYLDAAAALDWLAARGVGPDRVVLWGTSLGTGVAAEMARRGRCAALVLVAPYTSIPDLVTDRAPIVPASLLVPDQFATLSKASSIHVPTLVIHGDDDGIVPFWMGQRVAGAIPGATLVEVRGGHHGDLFQRGGRDLMTRFERFAHG